VTALTPLGRGNVHQTFLATVTGAGTPPFVLQRLNLAVFPWPEVILANLRVVSDHVRRRSRAAPQGAPELALPGLLSTAAGRDGFQGPDGSWWRALTYLAHTRAPLKVEGRDHAREVGRALGRFHVLLADLPPRRLRDPLPGFHHTPSYLAAYDALCSGRPLPPPPEVRHAGRIIEARRSLAGVLEAARARGDIPVRIIHGDPKVDNVLLEAAGNRAVGLVDLDTVMPGLVLHDLGDALRSIGNPLGEETRDWEEVRFAPEMAAAFLQGYREGAPGLLTPRERQYLYPALRLLAFELGLRFLMDYLAGNVYFQAADPEHNLRRALVQFRLLESLEAQEREIQGLIREIF
jgi:Ser/Thr protein kinase RdoA (MazF antagonist)